jgi:Spy/CpxP family protein refolding chaperone
MLNIRSALVGLLALGAAAAVGAQQPAAPAPQAHAKHGMRGGPGRGAEGMLMHGITLSDAEKANVKAVNAKYESQFKALRKQYQPQDQQLRAAHQRGDTAAVRSLMQQTAGQRDQMRSLMETQRTDLRNALTPDNQAKFDANVATMKQRFAKRGGKRPFGKPGQDNGEG